MDWDNRDYVLQKIKQHPYYLQSVSERLKNDRNIVCFADTQEGVRYNMHPKD